MLVKFKQAVHLKGKDGKGKDYARGTHEVSEAHLMDPFFHKLLKAGLVEDGEAAKVVAPLSLQDRQKALAEKLTVAPKQSLPKSPLPGDDQAASAADSAPTITPEPAAGEAEQEELAKPEAEEADEKAKASKKKQKSK